MFSRSYYKNILQMMVRASHTTEMAEEFRGLEILTCRWVSGKDHIWALNGQSISEYYAAVWMHDTAKVYQLS